MTMAPKGQPTDDAGLAQLLPGRKAPPQEDQALTYARQTRNAVVFIAWVAGIVMVLSLVGVIITANELAHLTNAINGGSNCIPSITC